MRKYSKRKKQELIELNPYNEDEEKFIYFKLHYDNACKFFSYNDQIRKRLIANKTVPIRFYDKLMGLLLPKDLQQQEHYSQIEKILVKNVIEYFNDHPEFIFLFKRKTKDEEDDIPKKVKDVTPTKTSKMSYKTYSFEEMIENVISLAIHVFATHKKEKEFEKIKDERNAVLEICYLSIINYIFQDKKIYPQKYHYKATVISGYIVMKLGYELSPKLEKYKAENLPPTNEEIKEAIVYYTNKFKIKRK
ncbi:MAG TPA: hypothetical protein VNX01_13710 [Bacteroidia bacterium]|jgi:hypothetical protein|nr:hypothetical protein [Bacteroidia bacterium]